MKKLIKVLCALLLTMMMQINAAQNLFISTETEAFILNGESSIDQLFIEGIEELTITTEEGKIYKLTSMPLSASTPRNYYSIPSDADKKEFQYILKTMAKASWSKLLSSKSALNKAGDKIDHLHPLRFWECIFRDEELKGYLHATHERTPKKIWNEYMSQCADSLSREASANNIKLEYIQDFARNLGVDINRIQGHLEQRRWKDFVNVLLNDLPRQGDKDRYNM